MNTKYFVLFELLIFHKKNIRIKYKFEYQILNMINVFQKREFNKQN